MQCEWPVRSSRCFRSCESWAKRGHLCNALAASGLHHTWDVTELRGLQRECALKRWEYQIARQVYVEVTRLAVADKTALELELREALVAYYAAHGALHSALRGERQHRLN